MSETKGSGPVIVDIGGEDDFETRLQQIDEKLDEILEKLQNLNLYRDDDYEVGGRRYQ